MPYIQRTLYEKVLFPGSVYDADGDWVGRKQLTACSQRQKFPGGNGIVCGDCRLHLEIALGDGAGFVHDNRLDAGQRFDGAAALEQDALLGCRADAGEATISTPSSAGSGAPMEICFSRWSFVTSSTMVFCTDTSRAAVASSIMRISGSRASALAIATRCR